LKVSELSIPGLFVLESPVWSDERGFFREWYKREDLEASGVTFPIHQANLSMSKRGVVRGLHYSVAPGGQAAAAGVREGDLILEIDRQRVATAEIAAGLLAAPRQGGHLVRVSGASGMRFITLGGD